LFEKLLEVIKVELSPRKKSRRQTSNTEYIINNRILELQLLQSSKFDFSKLITICEELNLAYTNGMYYSTAMLSRSILDHVPPIFGMEKFKEVANNYQGSKSFKECMQHLDNSMRKIADSFLHQTIRRVEDQPNENQIDCRRELDLLLGEIIRITKTESF
jgi:hypothetical protein